MVPNTTKNIRRRRQLESKLYNAIMYVLTEPKAQIINWLTTDRKII